MTTAAIEKTPVLFASKAVNGKEYVTATNRNRVLIVEQKGSTTGVKVKSQGYSYKETKVLYLANNTVLQELPAMPTAPKKAPAAVKAAVQPSAPKAVAAPSARIAKLKVGEKLPLAVIDGWKFRANYRARLSAIRAADCEAARKDSCRCRCAGSLHGKSHKAWFAAENELFAKSDNGAITAQQVATLVKKFGGIKHITPKKK